MKGLSKSINNFRSYFSQLQTQHIADKIHYAMLNIGNTEKKLMKSSSFIPYALKGLDSVQMNVNLLLRQKEFKNKCKGTYLSLRGQ